MSVYPSKFKLLEPIFKSAKLIGGVSKYAIKTYLLYAIFQTLLTLKLRTWHVSFSNFLYDFHVTPLLTLTFAFLNNVQLNCASLRD